MAAPALVMHGDRDLQPAAASRMYANAWSALSIARFAVPESRTPAHAESRVIPNAGHFVFNDQPEAFAEALGAFLEELE